MNRTVKVMEEKYLLPTLELVQTVFTESECLMVRPLVPGGLDGIHGQVCYSDYECLR